jgi:hypothetical protein
MRTAQRAATFALALVLLAPGPGQTRDHYRYVPEDTARQGRSAGRDLSVLIPDGLGLRIRQAGLDFLMQELPGFLPQNPIVEHIDLLVIDSGVIDMPWPIPDIPWEYGVEDLHISIPVAGDSVAADFRAPAGLAGTYSLPGATATGTAYAEALISATAPVSATGVSGAFTATIAVQDGQIVLQSIDTFTLALGSFDADLGFLEDILDFLGIDLDAAIQDLVEEEAAVLVQEQVPPLITDLLNEFLDFHGSFEGFEYLAEPQALAVDDQGGGLYFGAAVDALAPSSCVVPQPEPQPEPPDPRTLNPYHPSNFAATAADDFVEDAVDAAWDSGLLCFTSDPIPAEQLNQAIPIFPPGSSLVVSVSAENPPSVTLLTAQAAHAKLDIEGIHVVGTLQAAARTGEFLEVDLDASADAHVGLDPELSSITLRLSEFAVRNVVIRVNGDVLPITDEQVQELLQTYIIPLYNEQIGAIPLTTSVFTFQGLYFLLDQIEPMGGYLNVYLTAVSAPPFDTQAPETTLIEAPPAVTRQTEVSLLLGGADDKTIDRLLRFTWSLDGAPEVPASFARRIVLRDLAEGPHVLTARAWDLSDNIDPSPVSAEFLVDATAPVSSVEAGPSGWSASSTAQLEWIGQDNLAEASELRYAYRLDDGSGPAWTAYGSATSVLYQALADGPYVFEVRARDPALNEEASPAARPFTVDTHAPETSIRFGPIGTIPSGEAQFRFEAQDNLAEAEELEFSWRLTGPAGPGPWTEWSTSPIARLSGLAEGGYLMEVQSRDLAGNEDASPASRAFQVAFPQPTPTRTPTRTPTPPPPPARVPSGGATPLAALLLCGAAVLSRRMRA